MDLVDRDRRVGALADGAFGHPVAVGPAIVRRRCDDRRLRGRQFGRARDRIGLLDDAAVGARDLELVGGAGADARDEQLPDARAVAQPHRVAAPVPAVEVADHRDAARIGRPHREADALDALDRLGLRAEHAPEIPMPTLVEQVQIEIAEERPEAIGVLGLLHAAARPGDAQHIGRVTLDPADEQAAALILERAQRRAAIARDQRHRLGARLEGPHDSCRRRRRMRPQEGEGIVEPALDQRDGERAEIVVIGHHACSLFNRRPAARARPETGTPIQSGRLAAS